MLPSYKLQQLLKVLDILRTLLLILALELYRFHKKIMLYSLLLIYFMHNSLYLSPLHLSCPSSLPSLHWQPLVHSLCLWVCFCFYLFFFFAFLFNVHLLLMFKFLFIFNWNIVDLQCCVSFRWTAKWFNYAYTHMFSFRFFSFIGYYKILSIILCTK